MSTNNGRRGGRHSWLLDRSNPTVPAVVSVRGLQRVDVLANFGPPGTQHGTPEEEDEVGNTIMSMEEAARSEGSRRKMIAMVVAHTFRGRNTHNNGGALMHRGRERREREETSSTKHPQNTRMNTK